MSESWKLLSWMALKLDDLGDYKMGGSCRSFSQVALKLVDLSLSRSNHVTVPAEPHAKSR